MKNKNFIIAVGVFLILSSCDSDDVINQIFSQGNNDTNMEIEGTETRCDFEVTYNKIKNFNIVYNLYAPSTGKGYRPSDKGGKFVKFDLETGKITESETDWDIAFRYSTIILNGGKKIGYKDEPNRNANVSGYIEKHPFEEIKTVSEKEFRQDKKNELAISDNVQNGTGLWSYSMKHHYVLPIPGKALILKTRNGKYIKMQVKSFYKCIPKIPKVADESYGYYTFRYTEIK
ncbi:MAG: HmuY family protein [Flavobacteriaceae bacterium]|nr:HmuY family protein [Flavobacteriaceae bacterium]